MIGSLSENDTWLAKKLTNEHNSDNMKEVKRILSEHPDHEHHHIIKGTPFNLFKRNSTLEPE